MELLGYCRFRYVILFLVLLVTGCSNSTASLATTVTPTPEITSSIPTLIAATATPLPTHTPTHTPLPPRPTETTSATPELLSCPDTILVSEVTHPLQFLYSIRHEVWLYDIDSKKSEQLPLPEEAVFPSISPDGRYIAFLKQGQALDIPERPLVEIPLWVFNRQTEEVNQVAAFSTAALRRLYPESPYIYPKIKWLPDSSRLLVEVYPYPWGVGILQPSGSLYLVDSTTGIRVLLLSAGNYELFSLRPDGGQVAALDTAAMGSDGAFNETLYQQGMLRLIDTSAGGVNLNLPLKLARDPWSFMPPNYSPDGAHLIVNLEGGLGVVDTRTGAVQVVPLENTCLAENDCWWTDYVPVYWLPDSQSFYALQSINDYFDERAETTLSQVYLEAQPFIKTVAIIHANTISFSPNRLTITYWNQADVAEFEKNKQLMNWVTFYLMDPLQHQPRRYAASYGHRLTAWSPDGVHFLFTYSATGGVNIDRNRLGVGHICQPPQNLILPKGAGVSSTTWLDANHFLVWTYATQDNPTAAAAGLYLYDLAEPDTSVFISDNSTHQEEPYLDTSQVVVLP